MARLEANEKVDGSGRVLTAGSGVAGRRPAGGYQPSEPTVAGSLALKSEFAGGSKAAGRPKASPVTRGREVRSSGHITRSPMFANVARTIIN